MTARTLDMWSGKTPDTPIPPRVRARVFERFGGVCQLSGIKIMPGMAWQCDHRVALINGGRNEEANLWPVLAKPHRVKTAADVAIKSKVARMKAAHLGIKKPRTITSWRKMDGTPVRAGRDR